MCRQLCVEAFTCSHLSSVSALYTVGSVMVIDVDTHADEERGRGRERERERNVCVCRRFGRGVVDSNDPFHYGCHYRHVSGEEGILPCHIWSPCQYQHSPLSATHIIKYDHVLARLEYVVYMYIRISRRIVTPYIRVH